jgi:Ca2+-binding RTX toxin-like protein
MDTVYPGPSGPLDHEATDEVNGGSGRGTIYGGPGKDFIDDRTRSGQGLRGRRPGTRRQLAGKLAC